MWCWPSASRPSIRVRNGFWSYAVLCRHSQSFGEYLSFRTRGAWLLLENRMDGLKACLCWGLDDDSLEELVGLAHLRWPVEHFHKEAKQLLGLDDFEGRTWRAWYHHVTMVLLAYAFISMLRAEEQEGPLPSLRKTVIIIVQEMLTQMLMEKHGFERSVAYAVATDVRRGFTDWF